MDHFLQNPTQKPHACNHKEDTVVHAVKQDTLLAVMEIPCRVTKLTPTN